MGEASSRSVSLHAALATLIAISYAGWAAAFVASTAIDVDGRRYHCLFDDAMVSLRYAWNFAHGDGLVWNAGERVEGITSLLFTLIMALGALAFDKSGAALFVQVTGIGVVFGVALLTRSLARSLELPRHLDLVAGGAVLAYYPLSYWSLMGMETGALTALSLGALLLAVRLGSRARGSALLGLLLGLMVATRPDAAVPALVILSFRAFRVLLAAWRLGALRLWLVEAAVFAGVVSALTLFRIAYYGSPLPNTYDLKIAGWPLALRLSNGVRYVGPFFQTAHYLIALALVSQILRRDAGRLLALFFSCAVMGCQIWVGGDAFSHFRMLVPGVVVLIVLAVDGAAALARLLPGAARPGFVVGVGLALPAGALWTLNEPFRDEIRMTLLPYKVMLNRTTVRAGIELTGFADPRGSVAVAAAGALPYYSGLRGVDILGKSDRTIARLAKTYVPGRTVVPGHNKLDLDYSLKKLRPDVIYDAVSWSRHGRSDIAEFVAENYVRGGSFWLRKDSPHVHWDRVPP